MVYKKYWFGIRQSKKKSSRKKIAAEVIRRQLKEEVTGREQYYEAYFRVSEDGNGFYAIFVSVLGLIYAGCVVIVSRIGGRELMVLALAAMILACGAVCLMLRRRQRKTEENRLTVHILEKEFADVPVFFLTSRVDKQSVTKVMPLRPEGYLVKGQSPEDIKRNIDGYFVKRKKR